MQPAVCSAGLETAAGDESNTRVAVACLTFNIRGLVAAAAALGLTTLDGL